YSGAKPDQGSIAAGWQLRVDGVLDGSIEVSGERIQVFVNLLEVKSAKLLWSQKYVGKRDDLFTLEDTIMKDVAQRLRLNLNEAEKQRLTKHDTQSVEAALSYRLGQLEEKGNAAGAEHTRDGDRLALQYYEKAIQEDSQFALAHVALAGIYRNPNSSEESQQ